MNREQLSQVISQLDDRHIEEAAGFAAEAGKCPRRSRWAAAAACLAVVLILGSGTVVYAAEAREYSRAMTFFADNGLSAQGLSRGEVKAVYRDITTRRFTYGKTAEVIRRAVPGWEITRSEATAEELAALWAEKDRREAPQGSALSFRRDYRYREHETRISTLEASILECRRDEELLWTAEFTRFYLDDLAVYPEGIMVWGWNETLSSGENTYAWIAMVNLGGTVLWEQRLDHGFQSEYIAAVLPNDDGTWAVISRGDLKDLCLTCLDPEGKELSFSRTEVGNYGIWNAARLGDGYLVQLGSFNTGEYARLFRLDREGRVTGDFSYEGEDCVYHITDMAEFCGQVYLSAYAVPIQEDEGGRHEIANILDHIFARENWDISEEELTPLVRDNYTAVLLLCEPEGGVPKTFYSVKGALGGRLTVREGELLDWDTERVTSAYFSPATSAFSIGGSCRVFRYTFDGAGSLTGERDTGETAPYYR